MIELEFQLNNAPDLSMDDITKQLFNNEFMSDVQFCVEGRLIHAHSMELMKRSIVFQQQLASTLGEQKLIPITAYKYETFYQFLRFIYTDKFNVTIGNRGELLKLAITYKVVKLENKLLKSISSNQHILLMDYCVRNNYSIPLNRLKRHMENMEVSIFQQPSFLEIHQDTVEEILKLRICTFENELIRFKSLVNWMTNYCQQNKIDFKECRTRFDNLIRLIRFPTMEKDELRYCKQNYSHLLTQYDFMTIASEAIYSSTDEDRIWISQAREKYIEPYNSYCSSNYDLKDLETQFTVSNEITLCGIRFGNTTYQKETVIQISVTNGEDPNEIECLQFEIDHNVDDHSEVLISLGQSIRLLPNYEYTINFKFDRQYQTFCRNSAHAIIVNNSSVQILKSGITMIEMMFSV